MHKNVLAAKQFVKDREEAGLPVATEAQIKRAQRLIERDPTLRSYYSPLGLQILALRIPLTRKERVMNRVKVEIDDDGNVHETAGIVLTPIRIRTGDLQEVEANPAAVQAFIDANPQYGPMEAASVIGSMHGYADLTPMVARVERFSRSTTDRRLCGHMREKMLCLSAMTQAIQLCETRDTEEELKAKEASEQPIDGGLS